MRLPTEAEWEYACRAGTIGPNSFEGPTHHGLGNYNDSDPDKAKVIDGVLEITWTTAPALDCLMRPAPFGSLPPNPWGFHEMHGNLCEWTADRFHPDAFAGCSELTIDPDHPGHEGDVGHTEPHKIFPPNRISGAKILCGSVRP